MTCAMVSTLTALEAQDAEIGSLEGTQNLTGLARLDLGRNRVR